MYFIRKKMAKSVISKTLSCIDKWLKMLDLPVSKLSSPGNTTDHQTTKVSSSGGSESVLVFLGVCVLYSMVSHPH